MKTIKDDQHGILLRTFGLRGQIFLAVTIMLLFDLEHPEAPLTERELWGIIPAQLGDREVLDQGLPKPRGEVLATGDYFPPGGRPRPADRVSIQVGGLRKTLYVFGDRQWKRKAGIVNVISDPEPIARLPIAYKNAFGGEGFAPNPIGKGVHPLTDAAGRPRIPLPNVEDPRNLIADIKDRPLPAGFGPLDAAWPQRSGKSGTYGERWLRERWPHFPDDMTPEFFNAAPEDLFIDGYFQGDEAITITNMHPEHPVIESRLPGHRIRVFLTTFPDLKNTDESSAVFFECKSYIDTVRLFPNIMKGVAFYRASAKITDDEYADVHRILVASEKAGDSAKSIEYYLEEQKRRLPGQVDLDRKPFEEAQKKLVEGVRSIRRIPKKMEAAKLQAMDLAPKMPPPSPAEANAAAQAKIQGGLLRLTETEADLKALETKHGSIPVDLSFINDLREKMVDLSQKMDQLQSRLENARQQTDGVHDRAGKAMVEARARMSPKARAQAGFTDDLINPGSRMSDNSWRDAGFTFVVNCRRRLEHDREMKARLAQLGLDGETIESAWLGINGRELAIDPADWGLDSEAGSDGKNKALVIPAGLVLPAFQGAALGRIKIRTGEISLPGQDVIVKGSDESPLVLAAPSLVSRPPVVIMPDELEAWLMEQEIGDAATVISLADPERSLPKDGATCLDTAPAVLVVLSGSEAGDPAARDAWSRISEKAMIMPLPQGDSTLFEARRNGLDIRTWILDALPEEFADQHRIIPRPEPGEEPPLMAVIPPKIDARALADSMKKDIDSYIRSKAPTQDEIMARARAGLTEGSRNPEKRLALINAHLAREGTDLDALFASSPSEGPEEPFGFSEKVANRFDEARRRLERLPDFSDEARKKLDAAEAEILPKMKELDALKAGLPELESLKKWADDVREKGIFSEEDKEKFRKGGIDLDKRILLTRDQVIDRHQRGESLSQAILSGLDLSGLDLSGADLSNTTCIGARFVQTNLENANLRQINGQEADFTGAMLMGANLEKGMFRKAVFKNASLRGARFVQTMFQDVDLTRTDFTSTDFFMSTMNKVRANAAIFHQATLKLTSLNDSDLSDVDFSEASLRQVGFTGKTILDRADFSRANIESVLVSMAGGREVKFVGAVIEKLLVTNGAGFPEADFFQAELLHACFKDADLDKAVFRDTKIVESIMENCRLAGADFYCAYAPRTRFNRSDLEGADMKGLNLLQGSLKKARLVKTDLSVTNLFGVDFYKAVLGDTRFDGANLKMTLLHNRTDLLKSFSTTPDNGRPR